MRPPKIPPGTEIIRTYAEYGELIDGFFRGCYQLLFIIGRPGLAKSYEFEQRLGEGGYLIKGWTAPLQAYIDAYHHRNQPLIFDDAAQLMRAGGVFNWPDTFPLYARDELRDLLEGALQSSDSLEHLAGWRRIIDSQNKAKNQLHSLKRRFCLQHFWRLLRERHPNVFNRRLGRIEIAFADYFGDDESTIKLDRKELKNRLGANWDQPG